DDAREAMCQGLQQNDGQQRSKLPGRERPIAKDGEVKPKDEYQPTEVDPKGQQSIRGFTKGGSFKTRPANELGGVFRQAAQEAPEAIERQRVPPDAEAILKEYFRKLGNQK